MKGYLRVAALMPEIKVANPKYNIESIKEEILKANTLSVKLCLLPELCITGRNLQSLYHDRNILNESIIALFSLLLFSNDLDIVIVVSMPYEIDGNIYEVAFAIKSGKILGMVPKYVFSLNDENYLYFSKNIIPYRELSIYDRERNIKYDFKVSDKLVFSSNLFKFVITYDGNINEENSSNIICNIQSIPETIDIDTKIREIKILSDKYKTTIITATPGTTESTVRNAYFGRSFVAEVGDIITKNDIITNSMLISDIDLDKNDIINNNNFDNDYDYVSFGFTNYISNNVTEKLFRDFDTMPYINRKVNPYNYSMHIINILAISLAKRLKSSNSNNIIIGVSGGLDSTIALLIAKKTTEFMSLTTENIKAISMPGFGTTENTIANTNSLLSSLNIKNIVIDIKETVKSHFIDISHDIKNTNVTFENAQARERTQVLMDYANDCNGIVLGTGDLSEIALGFSTYNGDQMSMYNVNASLPKSLIRYILNAIADENLKKNNNINLANVLKNILHTKVSPEILPTDNGLLVQHTEDILGNYEIHDFILYNYLKYNFDYNKICDLAYRTFVYNNNTNSHYTEEYVKNCVNIFFSRFYKAQFKRVASPDSPDIGLPNLNSSFSFKMPSDAEFSI